MIRRLVGTVGLALAVVVGSAGAASAVQVFTTQLEGEEEVPRPGDLDGSGFAVVAVAPEVGLVCYGIGVFGIAPATAAHIHEAPRGRAGPIVTDLAPPTNGFSGGCVSDPEEAADIAADPSDYYVNVHNAEFPGGALRGQLG